MDPQPRQPARQQQLNFGRGRNIAQDIATRRAQKTYQAATIDEIQQLIIDKRAELAAQAGSDHTDIQNQLAVTTTGRVIQNLVHPQWVLDYIQDVSKHPQISDALRISTAFSSQPLDFMDFQTQFYNLVNKLLANKMAYLPKYSLMANDTAESEYRIDQLRKVTKLDVDYTSAFTKACRKAFPNKSNQTIEMYKRGRKMWKYIFSVLVAARKNYDHKDYISMDKNFGAQCAHLMHVELTNNENLTQQYLQASQFNAYNYQTFLYKKTAESVEFPSSMAYDQSTVSAVINIQTLLSASSTTQKSMKHHLLRGYNISSVRLKISVIASPVIIGMYVATVGKDHTINEIYWVAGGGTARLRTRQEDETGRIMPDDYRNWNMQDTIVLLGQRTQYHNDVTTLVRETSFRIYVEASVLYVYQHPPQTLKDPAYAVKKPQEMQQLYIKGIQNGIIKIDGNDYAIDNLISMGTIRDVDEPKIEIPAGPGFSIKSQMRNRFIDINLEDTLWTSKSGKIIRLLLNIARGLESKLQPGERELLHDLVQENGGSLAITSYSSPQMKDNINQISQHIANSNTYPMHGVDLSSGDENQQMKAIQAIAGTRATYPLRIEEAPVGQVLGKRFSAAPVPMAIQKIRGIGGSKRVDFGQYL